LTAAILLAATLLIATGSRGEEAAGLHADTPAVSPSAR
jgi:hypothetical protein